MEVEGPPTFCAPFTVWPKHFSHTKRDKSQLSAMLGIADVQDWPRVSQQTLESVFGPFDESAYPFPFIKEAGKRKPRDWQPTAWIQIDYFTCQLERGKMNGEWHLQGYIEFRLHVMPGCPPPEMYTYLGKKGAHKVVPFVLWHAHWEWAIGSRDQNITYITKCDPVTKSLLHVSRPVIWDRCRGWIMWGHQHPAALSDADVLRSGDVDDDEAGTENLDAQTDEDNSHLDSADDYDSDLVARTEDLSEEDDDDRHQYARANMEEIEHRDRSPKRRRHRTEAGETPVPPIVTAGVPRDISSHCWRWENFPPGVQWKVHPAYENLVMRAFAEPVADAAGNPVSQTIYIRLISKQRSSCKVFAGLQPPPLCDIVPNPSLDLWPMVVKQFEDKEKSMKAPVASQKADNDAKKARLDAAMTRAVAYLLGNVTGEPLSLCELFGVPEFDGLHTHLASKATQLKTIYDSALTLMQSKGKGRSMQLRPNPSFVIVVGCPGSGKTVEAHKYALAVAARVYPEQDPHSAVMFIALTGSRDQRGWPLDGLTEQTRIVVFDDMATDAKGPFLSVADMMVWMSTAPHMAPQKGGHGGPTKVPLNVGYFIFTTNLREELHHQDPRYSDHDCSVRLSPEVEKKERIKMIVKDWYSSCSEDQRRPLLSRLSSAQVICWGPKLPAPYFFDGHPRWEHMWGAGSNPDLRVRGETSAVMPVVGFDDMEAREMPTQSAAPATRMPDPHYVPTLEMMAQAGELDEYFAAFELHI